MIGHEKIIADLKSLHKRGELSHGYIFFGPAMVGKRTAARAFANFLEKGEFESNEGTNEDGGDSVLSDMMLISPGENGSIGIDAVREIRNFLWQKPNVSTRRTLIIDDAELLTTEAQNALLKITEEPPASSLLILITSDAESILPTITSRLPKVYFGTVPEKEIEKWLATGKEAKMKGVTAKKYFGKPGLAWRLLHDKDFQKQLELAEKLLKTPAATRRDLIKKIIEPDEFSFRKFLDAVIINLAWQGNTKLWHKALALYDRETNFSLNPRLQLESLLL
jgi:DNA polymerase-3 subunit delta'